jgi:hypothetical protein
MENNNKAFAYRFYKPFTHQCVNYGATENQAKTRYVSSFGKPINLANAHALESQ